MRGSRVKALRREFKWMFKTAPKSDLLMRESGQLIGNEFRSFKRTWKQRQRNA